MSPFHVILFCLLPGALAPFPPTHPLNPLNPWIEPWWEQLTKTEQKTIYGHLERLQPVVVALANAVEAKIRAKDSLKQIIGTKTKYLKELVHEALAAIKGKLSLIHI